MKSFLQPAFNGIYKPEFLRDDFIQRMAERVNGGLFPMASTHRNQYEMVDQSENSLRFRSTNFLTGINVGFNDVSISVDFSSKEIRYDVTYWVWAKFCIYFCLGLMTLVFLPFLLAYFGMYIFPRSWWYTFPPAWGGSAPSFELFFVIAVPMALFWGLIFPWLLIAFHKGPAAKGLKAILDEVNTASD